VRRDGICSLGKPDARVKLPRAKDHGSRLMEYRQRQAKGTEKLKLWQKIVRVWRVKCAKHTFETLEGSAAALDAPAQRRR
jgi:hypothetical protein